MIGKSGDVKIKKTQHYREKKTEQIKASCFWGEHDEKIEKEKKHPVRKQFEFSEKATPLIGVLKIVLCSKNGSHGKK